MAILIVDDEANTREVLRDMLRRGGYGPVLEAADGQEALAILDGQAGAVRLVISDWEMPRMDGAALLAAVEKRQALDTVPFLMITSDPPESQMRTLLKGSARLDGHLLKPFRATALAESLVAAAGQRAQARSTILYHGKAVPPTLQEAMGRRTEAVYWGELIPSLQPGGLTAALAALPGKVGALIVDPSACSDEEILALTRFKQTFRGSATVLVCAGQNAAVGAVAELSAEKTMPTTGWQKTFSAMVEKAREARLPRAGKGP